MLRALLIACLALLPVCAGAGGAEHGVILLYHRVSDSGPGSTRVSPESLAAHLDLIRENGYRVMPLADLLEAVYGGGEVPERSLALTFDDAYRSVGETAYPMLRERGMPFTVFVATDVVDDGSATFLDWPALRAMADEGLATFGAHSRSHAHLEGLSPDSATSLDARKGEIDGSLERLRSELGDSVISAFAYPYGEYSLATESLLKERQLFGLAQQSGALGAQTPRTRIPRFPFYVGGDGDERLRTALGARPLPVTDDSEAEILVSPQQQASSQWRFRPGSGPYRREALQCYAASGEPLDQQWEADSLVIELPQMKPGRNKVNCTAPAKDGHGYFWHSRLWLLRDAEGLWLRD